MIEAVKITTDTSVFEIGCGDGFLTRAIVETSIARLFVFEIDPEWAEYVTSSIDDQRLEMIQKNFLDIDLAVVLGPHKSWTVLANLPYQITFPILYKFQQYRHLLKEGVIMVQEEVAQKIVKKRGKGYGYTSLFFQHYFEWKLLDKIPPTAFIPPPKIFSRLLYFKPREHVVPIAQEEKFWQFIQFCFRQPRRTLKNNLASTHYATVSIDQNVRAQDLSMEDFLVLWSTMLAEL